MSRLDARRRPTSPSRPLFGALGVFALLLSVACGGENIFPTGVVGSGGSGNVLQAPTVEITTPEADAALVLGDSVLVTASIQSFNGVNDASMYGVFEGGPNAFVEQIVALSGATDTTFARFLQPTGTVTGPALIIVQARDVLGNTGADTVAVTVD